MSAARAWPPPPLFLRRYALVLELDVQAAADREALQALAGAYSRT